MTGWGDSVATAPAKVKFLDTDSEFDVRRLSLKPGDCIVLEMPHRISDAEADRIKKLAEEGLPRENSVIVLASGMRLGVLVKEDADA